MSFFQIEYLNVCGVWTVNKLVLSTYVKLFLLLLITESYTFKEVLQALWIDVTSILLLIKSFETSGRSPSNVIIISSRLGLYFFSIKLIPFFNDSYLEILLPKTVAVFLISYCFKNDFINTFSFLLTTKIILSILYFLKQFFKV